MALEPIDKQGVEHLLPETVAARYERFFHCRGCGRIYRPGSHYERMRAALGRALSPSASLPP